MTHKPLEILKALSQVEAVVVVEVAVVVAVATGVTVVVVVVRLMHPLALCSVNRRSTHKHQAFPTLASPLKKLNLIRPYGQTWLPSSETSSPSSNQCREVIRVKTRSVERVLW
jgi:hypothetical protein